MVSRAISNLIKNKISSIPTQNATAARTLFDYFSKIDRCDQFKSYYIKTQRSQIRSVWDQKDEANRIVAVYEELENKLKSHINFAHAAFGRLG